MKTLVVFFAMFLVSGNVLAKTQASPIAASDTTSAHTVVAIDSTLKPAKLQWGLGVTLGTPAGLNLVLQGASKHFLGRMAGFILPSVAGIQLEYGYLLTHTAKTNLMIGGVVMATDLRASGMFGGSTHTTWTGAGIAASTYLSGFFFEAGVTWGTGTVETTTPAFLFSRSETSSRPVSNPQAVLQIGYIWSLGK